MIDCTSVFAQESKPASMEQIVLQSILENVPVASKFLFASLAVIGTTICFVKLFHRIGNMEGRITQVENITMRLLDWSHTVDVKFVGIDQRLEQIEDRMDKVEAKLDRLDEKFDRKCDMLISILSDRKDKKLV